jgi:hypothetical protein
MVSNFFKTTVVVLLLSVAVSSYATPDRGNKDDNAGNAQITYVSSNAGTLSFDVKVDNLSGQKFLIVVKDETGSTLYRKNYTDKTFKKIFVLPKGDASRLTFYVKSDSGNTSESFVIDSNTRLVEEVVVTRVD